jgi:hypothetical protein
MIDSISGTHGLGAKPVDVKSFARDAARRELLRENLSGDSKVYKKVENFLNLGSTKDLLMNDLSTEERAKFFQIIAALVKQGIIGYHEYEINGKKEKHHIVNELGDRRLYGAKLARK